MTDHPLIIRDALITLFEADDFVKKGGSLGLREWWRRIEDGLSGKFTPFGYVEFQRRIHDDISDDIANIGYFFEFEIGVLANAKSSDAYKADDLVTGLMDKIEDVLLENRTVGGTVDDLAIPIEWEFDRGRLEPLYQDISWGVMRMAFKKQITARQ